MEDFVMDIIISDRMCSNSIQVLKSRVEELPWSRIWMWELKQTAWMDVCCDRLPPAFCLHTALISSLQWVQWRSLPRDTSPVSLIHFPLHRDQQRLAMRRNEASSALKTILMWFRWWTAPLSFEWAISLKESNSYFPSYWKGIEWIVNNGCVLSAPNWSPGCIYSVSYSAISTKLQALLCESIGLTLFTVLQERSIDICFGLKHLRL